LRLKRNGIVALINPLERPPVRPFIFWLGRYLRHARPYSRAGAGRRWPILRVTYTLQVL
jgi:hypothetical protein